MILLRILLLMKKEKKYKIDFFFCLFLFLRLYFCDGLWWQMTSWLTSMTRRQRQEAKSGYHVYDAQEIEAEMFCPLKKYLPFLRFWGRSCTQAVTSQDKNQNQKKQEMKRNYFSFRGRDDWFLNDQCLKEKKQQNIRNHRQRYMRREQCTKSMHTKSEGVRSLVQNQKKHHQLKRRNKSFFLSHSIKSRMMMQIQYESFFFKLINHPSANFPWNAMGFTVSRDKTLRR